MMKRLDGDTLVSECPPLVLSDARRIRWSDIPDPVLTMPDPLTAGWHEHLTPMARRSADGYAGGGQLLPALPPRAPGLTPRRRRVPLLLLALAHVSGWAVWGVVIGLLQ